MATEVSGLLELPLCTVVFIKSPVVRLVIHPSIHLASWSSSWSADHPSIYPLGYPFVSVRSSSLPPSSRPSSTQRQHRQFIVDILKRSKTV